jgi:two-component system chemotaxis response regulator CheB
MIKVLIVEDSLVVSHLLLQILQSDPEIVVVGQARNGEEAVWLANHLKPDVITMDINMPKLDGIEATKLIMQQCPTRIIIVSAAGNNNESKSAFEAIKSGALQVIDKPKGYLASDYEQIKGSLIKSVKLMSTLKVVTRWATKKPVKPLVKQPTVKTSGKIKVMGIGASTGGPAALNYLLSRLPKNFPLPILIVQHITFGFGAAFADWLNTESSLPVFLAIQGQAIEPGQVYIAPDGYHLGVNSNGVIHLTNKKVNYNHHIPSVNYLFESLAKSYGHQSLGLLLTGMGDDGALGLRLIREAGGRTFVQDEESSVVFGMPKEAIRIGAAEKIVPLNTVWDQIFKVLNE